MKKGYFDRFGGQFVPELLVHAVEELEREFRKAKRDPAFRRKLDHYLRTYAGRPTPLTQADNLSRTLGCTAYLKREDLLHTGAHKINNTLAQALLTHRMRKGRVVAETGAGQHGVATATACALMKIPCVVYMGKKDVERQKLNVYRMRLMGAEVRAVYSGSQTLKDATNEAIRDWMRNVKTTHYILGSAVGPHPYPELVRDFQSVIGRETKSQLKGRLPDLIVACVGGGSNAIGMFHPFLKTRVRLLGIEAAGLGLGTPKHAASLVLGKTGILHGSKSLVLQDEAGQIQEAHSISAGLDYPGVGPEHAMLKESGRVRYAAATDKDALAGFQFLSREEGIIPALEPSHAIGYMIKNRAKLKLKKNSRCVICLSGRGDKDVEQVANFIKVSS